MKPITKFHSNISHSIVRNIRMAANSFMPSNDETRTLKQPITWGCSMATHYPPLKYQRYLILICQKNLIPALSTGKNLLIFNSKFNRFFLRVLVEQTTEERVEERAEKRDKDQLDQALVSTELLFVDLYHAF